MKHITVTAAILINNNEILCMQRGENKYPYISYKFEFPGGKVETGESFEQALARELLEEMDISINIQPSQYYMTINHQYPDFSIEMHCYLCPVNDRTFIRREHISHIWLKPESLSSLDWAPADVPIAEKIMAELG